MENPFSRTEMLIGSEGAQKLKNSHIAVFGVGGVGSYAAEALARAGVYGLTLIDHDVIAVSNINRQIHAGFDTIGAYKADEMKRRILNINPEADVTAVKEFVTTENAPDMFGGWDYAVDAVDTVAAKLAIIEVAFERNIPVISSMGAGNKLRPGMLRIDDIYNTSVCPLARVMRTELRKRGVLKLKVCYSPEKPIKPLPAPPEDTGPTLKRQTPGSVSFVPSAAGLMIAGEAVIDLIGSSHLS